MIRRRSILRPCHKEYGFESRRCKRNLHNEQTESKFTYKGE
ncbi:hypothetical protein HMPREF9413_5062 [Paenibacillus sp. HGF7]|nr:hypothetical protein HMPREF9413_5062 [Paenibacillus sp. HGF7]